MSTATNASSIGVQPDSVASQLRGLEDDELATRLREAKEELFNLRFQAATGQLENSGRLRAVRRDIARIYTVLRERELGIAGRPGASPDTGPDTGPDTSPDDGEPATATTTAGEGIRP